MAFKAGAAVMNDRGDYILKPGVRQMVYVPNNKGDCVFRPYPAVVKGEALPSTFVNGNGEKEDTGWLASAVVCRFTGPKGISFIANCPDHDDVPSPAYMLRKAIIDKVEEEGLKFNPTWSEWVKERKLGNPQECWLMQGDLIKHGGKAQVGQDKKTPKARSAVVLIVPRCLYKTFNGMLTSGQFDYLTDLEAGNNLIFSPCLDERGMQSYEMAISEEPSPLPIQRLQEFTPWDGILNIQNAAWQVKKLVEAYDAEAVDYSLRGTVFEQYVPKEVRGAFARAFEGAARRPAHHQHQDDDDGLVGRPPTTPPQRQAAPPPPPPPEFVSEWLTSKCAECQELQYTTEDGHTCPNGHDNAPAWAPPPPPPPKRTPPPPMKQAPPPPPVRPMEPDDYEENVDDYQTTEDAERAIQQAQVNVPPPRSAPPPPQAPAARKPGSMIEDIMRKEMERKKAAQLAQGGN